MIYHTKIIKVLVTSTAVALSVLLSVALIGCPDNGGGGSSGSTPLPTSDPECTDITTDITAGSTTLTVSNSVLEVGEGRVAGGRQLATVTGVPTNQRLVVKRVAQGSTVLRAVDGEHYFYALGNALKIGVVRLNSDKSGCEEPSSNNIFKQAAGSYTVTLACNGCTDRNVTVEVRNVIALFNAINPARSTSGWQGNFGTSVSGSNLASTFCAAYLGATHSGSASTNANALVARLRADGFTAANGSRAVFFGSVVRPYVSNGLVYHFRDLSTDSDALNIPNASNGAGRNVHVYRVSSGTASTVTQFSSNAVTLGQLLNVGATAYDFYRSGGADGTPDGEWSAQGRLVVQQIIPRQTQNTQIAGGDDAEQYNFWSFTGLTATSQSRRESVVSSFYYSTANRNEASDSRCFGGTNGQRERQGIVANAWQVDGGTQRSYSTSFTSSTTRQFRSPACNLYNQVLCIAK